MNAGGVPLTVLGWVGRNAGRLLVVSSLVFWGQDHGHAAADPPPLEMKINFVDKTKRRTANPPGWIEYDGAAYSPDIGYGWLGGLVINARDRGEDASIVTADGAATSSQALGRLELANWQGRHQENLPLVFRIDLPNGWYRVSCASVDPGTTLPLEDWRGFKCRAKDAVFVGRDDGAPIAVGGSHLLEGSGLVEVTEEHLRVVVGDPAYPGWTWRHAGPWYSGWETWLAIGHLYARGWRQKLFRFVDPGFHHLRLNALEIEAVPEPPIQGRVVFADVFSRDDAPHPNQGLADTERWADAPFDPGAQEILSLDLRHAALRLIGPEGGSPGSRALLQSRPSPQDGVVRYKTSVSLFTGEGSWSGSGAQEAGLIILADPEAPNAYRATFVGVGYDRRNGEARGWVAYRVGDGEAGYRTEIAIPDKQLPFAPGAGEFEIQVEHDTRENLITRIAVNDHDVTRHIPHKDRVQPMTQGLFGLAGTIRSADATLKPRQVYWYYKLEVLE